MKQSQNDGEQTSIDVGRQATSDNKDGLQRVVEEAAAIARTPMAAVSIRDRDHHRLVAKVGLELHEALRLETFYRRVIRQPGEPFVILDAHRNEHFAALPTVLAAPFVRFYVGISLVDRAGYALGALYVADSTPRQEAPDLVALKHIAREAERLIARH